jgi:hypothetical protein
MTAALEAGEWSVARPGRTLSPKKTRNPLYSRLGGHQRRSGWAENLAPPPGFDLRAVQPVVSRYLANISVILYAFFWVIPRRLNSICRRFGTLCLFHLHRRVGVFTPLPAYEDETDIVFRNIDI